MSKIFNNKKSRRSIKLKNYLENICKKDLIYLSSLIEEDLFFRWASNNKE